MRFVVEKSRRKGEEDRIVTRRKGEGIGFWGNGCCGEGGNCGYHAHHREILCCRGVSSNGFGKHTTLVHFYFLTTSAGHETDCLNSKSQGD